MRSGGELLQIQSLPLRVLAASGFMAMTCVPRRTSSALMPLRDRTAGQPFCLFPTDMSGYAFTSVPQP